MIKLNKKFWRAALTVLFASVFVASTFVFNSNTARMQAGANTIAFDRYDDATNSTKVFVMNADGTNVTELANGYDPSWSANGAKIAYVVGNSEQYDIWTMNADGSEKAQLTQNYRSFAPAWSPDGTRIAFVSDHEGGYHVYVVNADGSNQQRLVVTAPEITGEYGPAWSPDSAKVIFLGTKVVNGLGREDYYQSNADGTGSTEQLTFLNALLKRLPVAVAPDGSRLVFEYQHDLQAALMNVDSQLVNISRNGDGTDEEPDYAPNGSRIVFRRGDYLSVMDANGLNVVNLDVVGSHPDWNPTAVLQNPTLMPTRR